MLGSRVQSCAAADWQASQNAIPSWKATDLSAAAVHRQMTAAGICSPPEQAQMDLSSLQDMLRCISGSARLTSADFMPL